MWKGRMDGLTDKEDRKKKETRKDKGWMDES